MTRRFRNWAHLISISSSAYFVTATRFPSEVQIEDSRKLLQDAVLVTVRNVDGELAGAIDTRSATGLDSLDFVVHILDGPRTYIARNIFAHNVLYEIRVVYVDSDFASAEFRGFADSFQTR